MKSAAPIVGLFLGVLLLGTIPIGGGGRNSSAKPII